jgi:hypothetical protein
MSSAKLGCPVANKDIPCHGCGGHWPGTRIRHEAMLRALQAGRIRIQALRCGTLKLQVQEWQNTRQDRPPLASDSQAVTTRTAADKLATAAHAGISECP